MKKQQLNMQSMYTTLQQCNDKAVSAELTKSEIEILRHITFKGTDAAYERMSDLFSEDDWDSEGCELAEILGTMLENPWVAEEIIFYHHSNTRYNYWAKKLNGVPEGSKVLAEVQLWEAEELIGRYVGNLYNSDLDKAEMTRERLQYWYNVSALLKNDTVASPVKGIYGTTVY